MLRNYFDTYGIMPEVREELVPLAYHLCLIAGEPLTVHRGIAVWAVMSSVRTRTHPAPTRTPTFMAPVLQEGEVPLIYASLKHPEEDFWIARRWTGNLPQLEPLPHLKPEEKRKHDTFLAYVLSNYVT